MKIFAANWKMHVGPAEARAYLHRFLAIYDAPHDDRRVIFCPPAVSLEAVAEGLGGRADLTAGAQNIYWVESGAFTGEVSAALAKAAGASVTLVGHSERRHVFGESDVETGHKCAAAVRTGLTPVLCVGEKLAEREGGQAEAVVLRQLRAGFAELSPEQIKQCLVAYEPVWAIGTGKNATPEDASAMHAVIRDVVQVPILYGGSVNGKNAASLLSAPNVDGVLVGGASLDPEGWARIVTG